MLSQMLRASKKSIRDKQKKESLYIYYCSNWRSCNNKIIPTNQPTNSSSSIQANHSSIHSKFPDFKNPPFSDICLDDHKKPFFVRVRKKRGGTISCERLIISFQILLASPQRSEASSNLSSEFSISLLPSSSSIPSFLAFLLQSVDLQLHK